jgi:hypothetical protein
VHILSIDTDTNNGNKGRTEQLIDRYVRIKGGTSGAPTADTFFSAKLHLYKFAPEYSGDSLTYKRLSGLSTGNEDVRRRNRELSQLLFDDDVQEFKLDHGYRAQTHLGSHLMYHAIVDAARRVRDGNSRDRVVRKEDESLLSFINQLYDAKEDARVFILGSIFGGTGASAIPIIPKALGDALKVRDKNLKLSDKARFACSLLTDYFSFNVPDAQQRKEQRVIADSNNFARNSQAALMFYEDDPTVQRIYDRMYHVGWPNRVDWSTDAAGGATVTGGGEQQNPAHAAELLCAAAAHHFFQGNHVSERAEIVYRSANNAGGSFAFEFKDIVGESHAEEFKAKLTAFYALCHIMTSHEGSCRNALRRLEEFKIDDYRNVSDDEARDLDAYFRSFAYGIEKNQVQPGWLMQVRRSVNGPFLLHADAFSDNPAQLGSLHFGKLLDEVNHQFAASGGLFGVIGRKKPFEEYAETLQTNASMKEDPARQKVLRPNEQFIARCYNTLKHLYNFR